MAMDSRSSSPETPEASDVPNSVTVQGEHPVWYHTLPMSNNAPPIEFWDDFCSKPDDPRMLQLDDIIQEHVYNDSACFGIENPPSNSHPPSDATEPELEQVLQGPLRMSFGQPVQESSLSIPFSQMHSNPVVPPPAVRACKRDPASIPRRIVYPPRESCYNLTILTPNIPGNGTKSRVETQVRVTVDLAHASTSAGEQNQYDRVGSWKWLRLPPGTSTKKRTRREGKIDPVPQDILHLAATVTCASAPHNRVVSCGSCRNREAKRVARKLAARVRPAHSDSDSPEDGSERSRTIKEDTTSIIQFNCPDVLDFSAGSTVLPVRITCYCRHHREKVGFNIHFTMMDHNGRLVGTGMTPPIMITDDHKSTVKSGTTQLNPTLDTGVNWSGLPSVAQPTDNTSPKYSARNTKGQSKTRAKPYDMASRNNQSRFSRETSVSSLTSPVNSPPVHSSTGSNTRSPTPMLLPQSLSPVSGHPSTTLIADIDTSTTFISNESVSISPNNGPGVAIFSPSNGIPTMSSQFSPSFTSGTPPATQLAGLVPPQPMPFLFFNPGSPPSATPLPLPKIHRLVPSSGPIRGGTEVTVLGENFHPAVQLSCVFGDVTASSTQRWSDNTLLCVLPPRSSPGVVAVWFEGFDETKSSAPPSLFTYTDESDRTLMELALQVVGLKMTGKIEDAKNIALRIVGSIGTEDSPGSNSSASDIMHVASSSFNDMQSLLFLRPGERHTYEVAVMKLLSLMDLSIERRPGVPLPVAMSHTTSSGQTLLHLAVFLKFVSLTEFLVAHGIDLDARDRNGYTALHFAALIRSKECARLLLLAGADSEIVDALGKTAQDIAPSNFFLGMTECTTLEDLSDACLKDKVGEPYLEEIGGGDDATTAATKRGHVTSTIHHRPHRFHDSPGLPENEDSTASQLSQTPNKIGTPTAQKLDVSDEKQTASFVALIQRTLAQIPAPQGIIPTIPQLPLPHLPEMPAVPWDALPQIPMVFPVLVPMPGWPSFLSDKRDDTRDESSRDREGDSRPTGYGTTAQELRAIWEKWVTVAIASATLRPPAVEEAPPMYTPRETEGRTTQEPSKDAMKLQEPNCESTPQLSDVLDDTAEPVDHKAATTHVSDADAREDTPARVHARPTRKCEHFDLLFSRI